MRIAFCLLLIASTGFSAGVQTVEQYAKELRGVGRVTFSVSFRTNKLHEGHVEILTRVLIQGNNR